ncbi:MAG TPA: hypothetical protein VFJ58_01060 [Armatimonadota bacterium]|nr:hypothetical protein [Armatimonadota bacterium]
MPVYLPTAVVGNDETLITLGHSGEIMAWFYPCKDRAQNIHECLPCVYAGEPGAGRLSWTWEESWTREQKYLGDSNICLTTLNSESLALDLQLVDLVPPSGAALIRHISIRNDAPEARPVSFFQFGDWNLGGVRTGNGLRFDRDHRTLIQSHCDVTAVIGGDALESWQCGKAGREWHNNALYDLDDGALGCSDLEIGDVNWAFGFSVTIEPGETLNRTVIFALGRGESEAVAAWRVAASEPFTRHSAIRQEADAEWLAPGLGALEAALVGGSDLVAPIAPELLTGYRRSLLCLPLLCGKEGASVAAPEFDPEFISCGGYGYLWPRDGAEYVSGLLDAGYPEPAERFFNWCARHQDPAGFWRQRYCLNGEPGPNWCLPPDTLQIDQVGAVLWACGKWAEKISQESDSPNRERQKPRRTSGLAQSPSSPGQLHPGIGRGPNPASVLHAGMIRRAAEYLVSRMSPEGTHLNAFDTWESFIGSFTYSNAAIYAGLKAAGRLLGEPSFAIAATRVKKGVLCQFAPEGFLIRGLDASGRLDRTVDSSALGAIEPFGLLDLNDNSDLAIALATLQTIRERLEVDWEGGRAIRRFEGDAYVGGVPACVNTLWMARCCLKVAGRLCELKRQAQAQGFVDAAEVYLRTVLRRATPTGLLPELMQGPTGQTYWAAPHGWAMASFVSGVLMLARQCAAPRHKI